MNVLPRYGEAFVRLFYPSSCATCGSLLELEERGLCLPCLGNFEKLRLSPSEEKIRISLAHGDEGWALFRYEDSVKEVLHKIKFEGRRDLIRLFANEMALFLKRRPALAAYDTLVPIPLDPTRRLEREFNQSGLIAQMIQKLTGIGLEPGLLTKKRFTPPQSLLGREARLLNLSDIFRACHKKRVNGRSILLVDDIFTTGATLEEAGKTVKRAGARRIGYLSLARAFIN